MHLQSLATAVPDHAYTQQECWKIAREAPGLKRLNRRSQLILRGILKGDSGIEKRHFTTAEAGNLFDYTPDQLNGIFRQSAPALAGRALGRALDKAGLDARALDALLVCTCTGYLCPGITSYVAENLGLRTDAFLQDLVGLGCGAAIPTMRAAHAIVQSNPDARVACIAVEVCSSAFYLDDDPGVLISACLFSDGAAASIWSAGRGPGGLGCRDFSTLHVPENRDKLRFEQRNGKLRNLLDPSVPQLASEAVGTLFAQESERGGRGEIQRIVAHPGGRDVLDALEARLNPFDLSVSRGVLRDFGNMSSPSVLFALERALAGRDAPQRGKDWWLVAFGAGFSAHACRFGVLDE